MTSSGRTRSAEGWWRDIVSRRVPYWWLAVPLLWLLSLPWRLVVCSSQWIYAIGLKRPRRAALPVVSVGNISMGGTGKTTACIYLARELTARGVSAGIVLRGYGRASSGAILVSDGANVLVDSHISGDEAALIANQLPGCPVAVAKRREDAVQLLADHTQARIALLDDGFQYYRMARDADIVLLDAYTPPTSDHVFPLGFLREPLRYLCRATDIWLTHVDIGRPERAARLMEQAKRHASGAGVTLTSHTFECIQTLEGTPAALDTLRGKCIIGVAGIGNPESFFSILEDLLRTSVIPMPFRDHHEYTPDDWETIRTRAADPNDVIVVTTPKDAVKLPPVPPGISAYVLSPTLRIDGGKSEYAELIERLCTIAVEPIAREERR